MKMNEQSSNEFFHGSSFMQGQNAEYLENLRLNFKENQNSVDSAWQAFFQSLESNASEPSESSVKPSWTRQDWPQQPNDELTNALMNEWNTDSEFAIRAGQEINAKANEANITLNNDAVNKFFLSINNLGDFGIIAPISQNEKYNNFNINEDKEIKEVDNVKGFAMFLNMKNLKQINFFDDNFFLYFEEIDLCRRLKKNNSKIFIDPTIKVSLL